MQILLSLFLTLSISTPLFADEACEGGDDVLFGTGIKHLAEGLATDCTTESIDKNLKSGNSLRKFSQVGTKELCKCLDNSKFMYAKVDNKTKRSFVKGELDHSISLKMKADYENLVSQFKMFENFIQTKTHVGNLINDSELNSAGGLCNLQTLEDELTEMNSKDSKKTCNAPKGFFTKRMETIFGSKDPERIVEITKEKMSDQEMGNCISKSKYLDMRSSAGGSDEAFDLLNSEASIITFRAKIESLQGKDKEKFKDLLSYNVIFNLAYRDSTFFHKLKGRMADLKSKGKSQYDVFQDKLLLKESFNSINRSCNQYKNNLKHYLCTDNNPALHPSIMGTHLEDYFTEKDINENEKKANVDYFTWQYSCNPLGNKKIHKNIFSEIKGVFTAQVSAGEQSVGDKDFERYLSRSVMIKGVTKDVLSDEGEKSDFAKFNKLFCKKDQPTITSYQDIQTAMKDFLSKKKAEGIDIASVLQDKKIENALQLKTVTVHGSLSFENIDPSDITAGRLPHISKQKWDEKVLPELIKKGMNEDEINQLYSLVEMQTNRVFSDVEDLKSKLVEDDPRFEKYSLAQIKAHSEGFTGNLTSEERTDAEFIQNRYKAQIYDSRMKVDYTQGLLLGEVTLQEVKNEAIAYKNNSNTFDNKFPDLSKGLNGSSNSKEQYVFGSGQKPNVDEPSGASQKTAQSPNPKLTKPEKGEIVPTSTNIAKNSEVSSPVEKFSEGEAKESLAGTSGIAQSESPKITPKTETTSQSFAPVAFNNSASKNSFAQNTHSKSNRDSLAKNYDESEEENSVDEDKKAELAALKKQWADEMDKIKGLKNKLNEPGAPIAQKQQAENYQNKDVGFNQQSSNNAQRNIASNEQSEDVKENLPEGEKTDLSDEKEAKSDKKKTSVAKGTKDTSSSEESSPSSSTGDKGASLPSASTGLNSLRDAMPEGFLTGDSTKESEEQIRKKFQLQEFQYHRFVPHELLNALGGTDKVVLLLGLYGREFKTIEAVSTNPDPNSTNKEVKYFVRKYDFVPEGKLEEYKEDMADKEKRNILIKRLDNLNNPLSAHHAVEVSRATKEVEKQEISKIEAEKLRPYIIKYEEAQTIFMESRNRLDLILKKFDEVEKSIKSKEKKQVNK